MTDRELLEFAAKAAGLDDAVWYDDPVYLENGISYGVASEKLYEVKGMTLWNPLEDDGDAFRLMVDLRLDISHTTEEVAGGPSVFVNCASGCCLSKEFGESDRAAATRRAIVTVAAEIGRGMG